MPHGSHADDGMPERYTPHDDDWYQNRKLIANELRRMSEEIQIIRSDIDKYRREDIADIKTDIALLRLKSSLWGAIMGGATGTLVIVAGVLMRLIK